MGKQSKTLRVGLFGFGRTGASVAGELIKDPGCELAWVVRKSTSRAGEYASRLQGLDHDEGRVHWVGDIDDAFFERHPVDVIIDFSASDTVRLYRTAARQGMRILSAISNYERDDLAELKKLARQTAVLYSPNISIGV
ncbi:MAG: dihydrodipicolinate reductase, partial [Verrucomicrobiota bacterium]|nr:dihydrodipicolinate reductase [Verrucomicrobiota bacterium]